MKNEFSLSKFERLSLINQYEILKRLAEDEDEIKIYKNFERILTSGYELEFEELVQFFGNVSYEDCLFIRGTFEMFDNFSRIYLANPSLFTESEKIKLKFLGFDGNSSNGYYSYVRYVAETYDYNFLYELRELPEDRGYGNFNSHGMGASVEELRRMYEKYTELVNSLESILELTAEDVKAIIN